MKKICTILLIVVLISGFVINCYAATENTDTVSKITKEQLNEKFSELKEYINSSDEEESSKIEEIVVGDKTIEVTTSDDKYEINYELGSKTTFSIETEIKQGMSYDDYKKNTARIDNVFWGYCAVANILGIKYEDSAMYYMLSRLSGIDGSESTGNSYTIYTPVPGVTLVDPDENVIISTEFGNRAMEYFNSVYQKDKYTYNDSEEYNTFECVTEKKEKTDTFCKLVETLTINTEADFSKINGKADSLLDKDVTKDNADYVYTLKVGQKLKFETSEDYSGYECVGTVIKILEDEKAIVAVRTGTSKGDITFGNITKSFYITVENNENNENVEDIIIKIDSQKDNTENIDTTPTSKTEKIEDNTTSKTDLPKTGISTIAGVLVLSVVAIIVFATLNKKYEDIK